MFGRYLSSVAMHLLAIFLLALGGFLYAAPGVADKRPVPPAAAQDEAKKIAKETYGEEYAKAGTPSQQLALAQKLFRVAQDSQNEPAAHFVLLRLAKDIATGAGEIDLSLKLVDEIDKAYQVDGRAMRSEVLTKALNAAASPKQRKSIAEHAQSLAEQALVEDDFPAAAELAEIGVAAARGCKDSAQSKESLALKKRVEEASSGFSEIKAAQAVLAKKPDDQAANLQVGKYLCFTKGDWDKGIAMLARASDPALKAAASKELQSPSDAQAQAAVGDDWWDLARADEHAAAKKSLQLRAAYWYRQAADGLKGLTKLKIEKRLRELEPVVEATQPVGKPVASVGPKEKDPAAKPHPLKSSRKPRVFNFTTEASVKQAWQLPGNEKDWQISNGALFLHSGQGSLESKFTVNGDCEIGMSCAVYGWCTPSVSIFGEEIKFPRSTFVAFDRPTIYRLAITRRGATLGVRFLTAGETLTIKDSQLNVPSTLRLTLDSRHNIIMAGEGTSGVSVSEVAVRCADLKQP